MHIREIKVQSFRHLQDIHLGPFAQPPRGSDLVVLAGPNGGGKSSILELLGYALSSSWSLSWTLARSFPSHSFEVAIELTPEERQLVRDFQGNKDSFSQNAQADKYLAHSGIYYRSYNFPSGEYQKNAGLHNVLHQLVTQALRNHYHRSTGFFLKSDRSYPQRGFRRESLFEYEQRNTYDHIWNLAFQTTDVQYNDMHEFLLQQRYHFDRRLGKYHRILAEAGAAAVPEGPPSDPLIPYDSLLQRLFPGYKFVQSAEEIPSNLFVQIPSGDIIPFNDLSSGEKEVFFILSFFLRHDVSNSIIVIDEPELHLHPELARILVRTMQSIKPGNQVWLATHNAEVIDEAGRDRVFYVTKDPSTRKATVTAGLDEAEAIQKLRDIFGYSGFIGIAKRMVFLEGVDTSADRKAFSNLFPNLASQIKLIPAQSTGHLQRLNSAVLSILESNLGWMEFYLIRDRDYMSDAMAERYVKQGKGRLHVLQRCHIENYLLNDDVISRTLIEIFNISINPADVRRALRKICAEMIGEVLRDMIAFRLNVIFQPEDFSLGKLFQGEKFLDASGKWIPTKLQVFETQIAKKIGEISAQLSTRVAPTAITAMIAECRTELELALDPAKDEWRSRFPGKAVLEAYAKELKIGKPVALINSLIKELATTPDQIPADLTKTVETISMGNLLPH